MPVSNAGWYPDPAGAPDTYRYWDGSAWSQVTTTDPAATPAPGAAEREPAAPAAPAEPEPTMPLAMPLVSPSQPSPSAPPPPPPVQQPGSAYGDLGHGYGQYGDPAWSAQPYPGTSTYGTSTYGTSTSGNGGRTALIVAAVVGALFLVGLMGFIGVRVMDVEMNEASGGSSGEDVDPQVPVPSAPLGEDPGDGLPDDALPPGPGGVCAVGDPTPTTDPGPTPATISGGGLTIERRDPFQVEAAFSEVLGFADDVTTAYVPVTDSWIAEYAVGGLPVVVGDTPKAAAETVYDCITADERMYSGFSGRTDLTAEAVRVDGRPAYRITAEVRVDDPSVGVEGDVTTVIVVDTGDDEHYGFYLGVVPIGVQELIDQADEVAEGITVD